MKVGNFYGQPTIRLPIDFVRYHDLKSGHHLTWRMNDEGVLFLYKDKLNDLEK